MKNTSQKGVVKLLIARKFGAKLKENLPSHPSSLCLPVILIEASSDPDLDCRTSVPISTLKMRAIMPVARSARTGVDRGSP